MMRFLPILLLVLGMASCAIQPPLYLADGHDGVVSFPEVQTDINVVWDIDADWRSHWYYGWDEEDERNWGKIEYPEPSTYEVRLSWRGLSHDNPVVARDAFTVRGSTFTRRFNIGSHDMLVWSNIDSDDGTQALIIDESEADDVHATTSRSRLAYALPSLASRAEVHNDPEIFYAGLLSDLYMSDRPEDYDYYDSERDVWIKHINMTINPLVYIYLVQVVIYNNNGRIEGLTDRAGLSSMADGVSVHTGHTHATDVVVSYDMRLKKGLKGPNDRDADIIGGKLTTFGLCDMDSWARSRSTRYSGGRSDLKNHVMLGLHFSNSTDSAYSFEVTEQMQRQAHGGVITVELDADTLKIPTSKSGGSGSVFDPTISEWTDSITHSFDL